MKTRLSPPYLCTAMVMVLAMLAMRLFHTEVTWQGETFGRIADSDVQRIDRIYKSFVFQDTHAGRESLLSEVRRLRFPGAGMASVGRLPSDDGNTYQLHEFEVPSGHRNFAVLHRVLDAEYSRFEYVDSFFIETMEQDELLSPLREIRIEDGVLRYSSGGREYKSYSLKGTD